MPTICTRHHGAIDPETPTPTAQNYPWDFVDMRIHVVESREAVEIREFRRSAYVGGSISSPQRMGNPKNCRNHNQSEPPYWGQSQRRNTSASVQPGARLAQESRTLFCLSTRGRTLFTFFLCAQYNILPKLTSRLLCPGRDHCSTTLSSLIPTSRPIKRHRHHTPTTNQVWMLEYAASSCGSSR